MQKYIDKIKSIIDESDYTRKGIDATKTMPTPMISMKISTSDNDSNSSNLLASMLFAKARAISTITHFDHLTTDSFSKHSALNTFYKDIIDLIDDFCEAYIGLYGKFISLPPVTPETEDAEQAIIEFRDWIKNNRAMITDDSSLQNIIDEIYELCNSTLYKLQKLH